MSHDLDEYTGKLDMAYVGNAPGAAGASVPARKALAEVYLRENALATIVAVIESRQLFHTSNAYTNVVVTPTQSSPAACCSRRTSRG